MRPALRSGRLHVPLAAVLALVALLAWALASPVGASPDEDYHLTSIWCGQGIEPGTCETGQTSAQREVPATLIDAACYRFEPETSASCQTTAALEGGEQMEITDRGNFNGGYPPVFYATMSLFVGDDVDRSVVAMRVFNSVLAVLALVVLYLALPPPRRGALLGATLVTALPLGVFLLASINPSGWAFLSACTLFPALVGYLETHGRRKLALGTVAVVATALGAGARADAAFYSALAVVAAVFLGTVDRRRMVELLLPAGLLLVCALSYLTSGQSDAATGSPDLTRSEYIDTLVFNVLNAPELWLGSFGPWGLGWIDTTMPAVVPFFTFTALFAALITGVARVSPRRTVALLGVLAVLWAVPVYILMQSGVRVGEGVQPRYLLPLVTLAVHIVLFRPRSRWTLTRSQALVVLVGLAVAYAVALHTNIRRYVTGTDFGALSLDARVEWWWNLWVSPMTVWLTGTVAFAALLAVAGRHFVAPGPAHGDLPAAERVS